MRVNSYIIFIFIFFYLPIFPQKKIQNINLTDSVVKIDNIVFFNKPDTYANNFGQLKKVFPNKKFKKKREEPPINTISYYCLNSGVEFIQGREVDKIDIMAIYYNTEKLSRFIEKKVGVFEGRLTIFDYGIDKNTTFGEVRSGNKFKKTCRILSSTPQTIRIDLCGVICEFVFKGIDDNSKIWMLYVFW